AAARRQWGEAEEALGRALAMAQSIDNPRQLWKTHLAMAQLHTAMKKPESARQAHETACQVIERVKANLRDPRLRAGLERSPLVPEL
ncbi:MAG TPA: hypothetical protein VFN71_11520, partial [Methylomirabilota bacterium]|nr:hypothetical protein [Methylomirabilota bacterium]